MTTLRKTPAPSNGIANDGETAYVEEVAANVLALWGRTACWVDNVAGTNTVTGNANPVLTAQAARPQGFWVIPVVTNTSNVTLNLDGFGALALVDSAGLALAPGAFAAGTLYLIIMDGTQYRIVFSTTTGSLVSNAPDLIINEEQTTNTAAGTYASLATIDRAINTVERNVLPGASLDSTNKTFTLQPGTYLVEFSSPGYQVDAFQAWLFNSSDAARVEPPGGSSRSATGSGVMGVSSGLCVVTITTAKNFKIQWRGNTTNATNGLGIASNVAAAGREVYTQVRVTRVGALTSQVTGQPGGAITIPLTFSTTTTDADPGNGVLRLNNATQNTATLAYIDLLASDLTDYTSVLDSLITGSILEGYLRLSKTDDPTKWLIFRVNAWTTAVGYRKLTLAEVISSSAANPFANGDNILFMWTPRGVQGPAGVAGAAGSIGTLTAASTGFNLINGTIVESHAGNAVTYAVKDQAGADPSGGSPVYAVFRDVNAGLGAYSLLTISAALSVTVSSGSTLGAVNAIPFKIWLVLFLDTANVPRLGVINCVLGNDILSIGRVKIASSVAEGGAGAADSAQVFYTGTAVANRPFTIVGAFYYEAGLATAGTWNVTPGKIELFGLGVPVPGQVIQDISNVTGAVATGTTVLPRDDTIPQSSEGDQYMSQAIVPTSATHILEITSQAQLASSATGHMAMALFQDAVANALATTSEHIETTAALYGFELLWTMIAALSVSTTFKIRAGQNNVGTTSFNGEGGTRRYGGTISSYIRIKEIVT